MEKTSSLDPTLALAIHVGTLLTKHNLKLATAESCTGGLVGHLITNIAGSSEYFLGGVIAYAYEAKVRLLGVRWETLNTYGAVSQETVLEMAHGVRKALVADLGLSISGIAGPGGATPTKPLGFTWIGLSTTDSEWAWQYVFPGERMAVKNQAANEALRLLATYLAGKAD